MRSIGTSGPELLIDATVARFLYRTVEHYELHLERVAPAQLGAARTVRADLARYLQEVDELANGRATSATDRWRAGDRPVDDGSGRGCESPVRDQYTVAEAARFLSCSESYVRRMAQSWGGVLVADRWVLPAEEIENVRRARQK